ncbi:hypothetical protein [Alkaliphilus sp. B6464]|uniref:hypothetical protein n=1 Tax=Alkaliphilus sp. B6464 TaxID=2731219 RepID=UPI001BA7746A|nr:hypothetical protein [Alkaliphilus sp. B6464]QUH22097.1 hypothetical protein HYG84_19515 [Alkaliphilus sp. B6464]
MGRRHQKITGFHTTLMQNTSFDFAGGENILINSISLKGKILNYVIKIELFKQYVDIIFDIVSIEGEITHKEIIEILFSDIYKIYKTKVATKRIPFLILNLLVEEGLLYTDNGEDYILKSCDENINQWKKGFFSF